MKLEVGMYVRTKDEIIEMLSEFIKDRKWSEINMNKELLDILKEVSEWM